MCISSMTICSLDCHAESRSVAIPQNFAIGAETTRLHLPGIGTERRVAPREAFAMRAPGDEEFEPVYEAPEGEEVLMSRTCDGFVTEAFEAVHGTVRGSGVRMVTEADGQTVWLSHMASEYPVDTWIRASREGDILTVEGAQPLYMEYDWDTDEELYVYLVPMHVVIDGNMRGTFVATDDLRFDFKVGEDGSLTAVDPELLLGVCVYSSDPEATGNDVWVWAGFGDRDITMHPVTDVPLSVPEGLEMHRWVFTDEYANAFVNVGIRDDEMYIQGMSRELPDAWVRGEIRGDKVIFPSGQYLGYDEEIYYLSYFCGADFRIEIDGNGEDELVAWLEDESVFSYDAEAGRITSDNGYVINSTPDRIYPLYFYTEVTVGEQSRNHEAEPAAPYDLVFVSDEWSTYLWFQLPNTDVEGNLLDEARLWYEILVDGEPVIFEIYDEESGETSETGRIPYGYFDWDLIWVAGADHTVYFDADADSSIGVRSVYLNEEGKELMSAVSMAEGAGIGAVAGQSRMTDCGWYDLQGRALKAPAKGVVIRRSVWSDGSVRYEKVVR